MILLFICTFALGYCTARLVFLYRLNRVMNTTRTLIDSPNYQADLIEGRLDVTKSVLTFL